MQKHIPLPGKEAFCVKCLLLRPFYTELNPTSEMLPIGFTSAVKVVFPEVIARCVDCGTELYVPDIHDMNMEVRRQAHMNALYKEATKEDDE